MTKTINIDREEVLDAFTGKSLSDTDLQLRPVSQTEQDLVDAFVTCRRNCSAFQMDMCEKNGVLPGMPECK